MSVRDVNGVVHGLKEYKYKHFQTLTTQIGATRKENATSNSFVMHTKLNHKSKQFTTEDYNFLTLVVHFVKVEKHVCCARR